MSDKPKLPPRRTDFNPIQFKLNPPNTETKDLPPPPKSATQMPDIFNGNGNDVDMDVSDSNDQMKQSFERRESEYSLTDAINAYRSDFVSPVSSNVPSTIKEQETVPKVVDDRPISLSLSDVYSTAERPTYRPLPNPPGPHGNANSPHGSPMNSPQIGSPASPAPVFQGGVFLGYNSGSTLQQRPDFHPNLQMGSQFARPRPGGPMYARPPPDQMPLGLQVRARPDMRPEFRPDMRSSMGRPGPRPPMPMGGSPYQGPVMHERPRPNYRPMPADFRPMQGDFRPMPGDFRPMPPNFRPFPPDFRPPPGWRPPGDQFRPVFRPLPPDFRPPPGWRPPRDMPMYRPITGDFRPEMRPDIRPGMRPEMRPQIRPDVRPEIRPEVRPDVRPEINSEVRPQVRPDVRPEIKPEVRQSESPQENNPPRIDVPLTETSDQLMESENGHNRDNDPIERPPSPAKRKVSDNFEKDLVMQVLQDAQEAQSAQVESPHVNLSPSKIMSDLDIDDNMDTDQTPRTSPKQQPILHQDKSPRLQERPMMNQGNGPPMQQHIVRPHNSPMMQQQMMMNQGRPNRSPVSYPHQPMSRPPPQAFQPRPGFGPRPSYLPVDHPPGEFRPRPSYMPIDNAPRPMIRPPPQMFPGRPMMINPNMRPGPFPGFAIRPDGYRDNSINIDPPKSPEIRRSFDKDNTPPGMHRSESLDDRSLQRKRFNSIAPPSESDMDDTDNDSRRSSSVVNLEVAPIPSFSTIRRRPAQQQHMLSVEQMIDQHREASKNSTDPKVQFEFAKACLAAGEPYVEEGFALLKKIASAGFPEANYFLGEAFADDGKHSMAYSQYLMAAKRGYAPACHAIACCAEAGQGCKKSTRLALEMYTKAATAGNLDSMYRLGLADLNGELGLRPDIQKAVKWFKRAAAVPNRNHPEPLFELSKIYETGVPPYINQDFPYARGVLMEASDFGYPPAIYKLGYCYEHGLLGLEAESIRLYTIAMKQGDPDAMLGMAGWHMTGADGILAKSEARAFQLVLQASEKELPRAQYTLGYFYEGGIGTEKNSDLAFQFYYKAAEQGEDRAIQRIQRSDPDAKLFARKISKKKKSSFFGGLFGK